MNVNLLLVTSDREFATTVQNCVKVISSLIVEVVPTLEVAEVHLGRQDVDIAVVHVQSREGATLLQKTFRDRQNPALAIPVLAIIEEGLGGQLTLELLKGAQFECLTRPLDLNRLTFLIDSLTFRKRAGWMPGFNVAKKQRNGAVAVVPCAEAEDTFLYSSPSMIRLVAQVRQIADRQNTIVITGETGTGKTHLARFVHNNSCRRQGNLVHVDCGAVPENLIEGELFGYRKGAFTGASQSYDGKCAAAAGGTLFLDEIDALSPAMQSRLLRLTDEHVYSSIGVVQEKKLDARIIVGTNRNLEHEVATGKFRQDLYFRLSVFELQVPPLRERLDEIRLLTAHIIESVATAHGTDIPVVEEEAWQILESYHWPGNVRELRNSVERFMAFCSNGVVQLEDLSPSILRHFKRDLPGLAGEAVTGSSLNSQPRESKPSDDQQPSVSDTWIRSLSPQITELGMSRDLGEFTKIVEVLRAVENNRTRASQLLGISREALYKKLRKYNLLTFNCKRIPVP